MRVKSESKDVALDLEWVILIKQAKLLGLTLEEVREFLQNVKESKFSY